MCVFWQTLKHDDLAVVWVPKRVKLLDSPLKTQRNEASEMHLEVAHQEQSNGDSVRDNHKILEHIRSWQNSAKHFSLSLLAFCFPHDCGQERSDTIVNIRAALAVWKSIIKSAKLSSLLFRLTNCFWILEIACNLRNTTICARVCVCMHVCTCECYNPNPVLAIVDLRAN